MVMNTNDSNKKHIYVNLKVYSGVDFFGENHHE